MWSIWGIMSSPGGAFGKGRESGRLWGAAHADAGMADGNASAATSAALPLRKSRRPMPPPARSPIAPTGGGARTSRSFESTSSGSPAPVELHALEHDDEG